MSEKTLESQGMRIGALVQMLDARDTLRQGIVIDTTVTRDPQRLPRGLLRVLVAWDNGTTSIERVDDLTPIRRPALANYEALFAVIDNELELAIESQRATATHVWSACRERLQHLQASHETPRKL